MSTDIHSKVFDDGTQIKLHILREYLKQWLPVFLIRKPVIWKKVFLYDFFAGEGSDSEGNHGSPRIILGELKSYCKSIISNQIEVKVIFNEFKNSKVKKLKSQCNEQIIKCEAVNNSDNNCPKCQNNDKCAFNLVIENKDFNVLFGEIYPKMFMAKDFPRFMFLDQYGIKYITEDIFRKISDLERTDFIFFISSSFARRFIEGEEFQKYLKLKKEDFNVDKPYHCHRVIFNYYKSLIRPSDSLLLAPFSIKKNNNIYGLIFGTHHTLGMEKFLNIGWKINEQTGDANFDIDDEMKNSTQGILFDEFKRQTKLQFFETELRDKIILKELTTNCIRRII